VLKRAELTEEAQVRGCFIIRPYGFGIWELIQSQLDVEIKRTGHKNLYFPLFIPESFIRKEAQQFEGFSPELAVVTHGGGKELADPLVVRPTSETIIYATYKKWIHSYRDLPLLFNQWANVVRWEMRPRAFLRTTEFLWQEGHTAHETNADAQTEVMRMLEVYATFAREKLAIPVIKGRKTEQERFPGADATYSIEGMMRDGKALQMGTSHNLGQNFSTVFDIDFTSRDGGREFVWLASWGVSTRLIGAIIMVHGDERGLRLPPEVAPVQVVIVPAPNRETHMSELMPQIEKAREDLTAAGIRVEVDQREQQSVGFKYNEWEVRGVPLRLEYGAKERQRQTFTAFRRDTLERFEVGVDVVEAVRAALKSIQDNLLAEATTKLEQRIVQADKRMLTNAFWESHKGFARFEWCGNPSCEDQLRKGTKAKIVCLPLDARATTESCLMCGSPANHMALAGISY